MLGAELATPADQVQQWTIREAHVTKLEQQIDEASAISPPMRNFVLPGGHLSAARLHLARTVCRRAERAVVALARDQAVGEWVVPYLNRLSDLLFALARAANTQNGVEDIPWTPES
jgi:cob(I)alamin adenosyltransferase